MQLAAAELRVAHFVPDGYAMSQNYPNALPGLLENARRVSGLPIVPEPLRISSFQDPRLAQCPFLYVNWEDSQDWRNLPENEIVALRKFLQQGGFLMVDAGIAAEFLRKSGMGSSQHHSYAEWQESPEVREFFQRVLPENPFQPLGRDDPIFHSFYQGLPDPQRLPPTVQEYTIREKWPSGTYSAVGIRLNGKLAVLATPVIAMGWGQNNLGSWTTTIQLRVLEGGKDLNERLPQAAAMGPKFQVRREDGGTDNIYCQGDMLPAWIHEPTGRWRVFRYYNSRQISDYAHVFYTRLGVNFLIAACLGD